MTDEDLCWAIKDGAICGLPATPDIKGRMLCPSHRFFPNIDPFTWRSPHGLQWYETHCWHCSLDKATVPHPFDDDLGLCEPCKMELRNERDAAVGLP